MVEDYWLKMWESVVQRRQANSIDAFLRYFALRVGLRYYFVTHLFCDKMVVQKGFHLPTFALLATTKTRKNVQVLQELENTVAPKNLAITQESRFAVERSR